LISSLVDEVSTHQDGIRVVPGVPQDPEPHGSAEQLSLEHLLLGDLRRLSVQGSASCPETHRNIYSKFKIKCNVNG